MKSTFLRPSSLDLKELLLSLNSIRDWRRMIITYLSNGQEGLRNTSSLSHGHGSQSAEGEALQVLSWLTRIHPLELDQHLDANLCESEKVQILGKIEQRLQTRQPMAYILGEAWFGPLRLKSDARALVPRSLILEALGHTFWEVLEQNAPAYADRLGAQGVNAGRIDSTLDASGQKALQILDLCTGGGSIAIKAALDFPAAHITASDLSQEALSLAQENLELFSLSHQVSLNQGHLFNGLECQFDLILCNPPYVNEESMAALPAEFVAEPRIALAGGDDGMDLIREIFRKAPRYMAADAHMLLEIGHEAHNFEAAFPWLNYSYVPVTAGENMLVLVSRSDLFDLAEAENDA
jgi:ribosomal protein L3 glutamine methyltransferase